jgi:hypothetical protein
VTRNRPRIQPGDGDPRHGTYNGYSNLHCNCEPCRVANADYNYGIKQRRIARGLTPDDPRHGTTNGYGSYGCRCRPCTDAWSAMMLRRARQRRAATR